MNVELQGHKLKISIGSMEDDLGKGNGWGIRNCEVKFEDGEIIEGYIQGDEHSCAEETLELYCARCEGTSEVMPDEIYTLKPVKPFNLETRLCFDCNQHQEKLIKS